jgi:uncharacterized protein YicC (UPF0701 family)
VPACASWPPRPSRWCPPWCERQQARFLERWQEALATAGARGQPRPSARRCQERALNEAATFALRIDVAEELARLRAHLDEIDRLLQAGGRAGQAPGLPDPGTAPRGQHAGLEAGGWS